MKRRHLLMGVGLVAAAGLFAFGDNSPNSEVAEPVQRLVVPAKAGTYTESARPAALQPPASRELSVGSRLRGNDAGGARANDAAVQPAGGKGAPHILRVQPRHALIGADGLGGGGDVFVSHDWTPPPPAPVAPPPPPPPSAPPLPFTLIGKGFENGAWEVYLSRSGKTYIVKPKTVIDGMYRVDAIAPPILTFTYLPLNQVQQLNIGAFD
jgi:hypothetical protein